MKINGCKYVNNNWSLWEEMTLNKSERSKNTITHTHTHSAWKSSSSTEETLL